MADLKDTITVDVPLFIRLLEFAREDAKDDMALHNVAEAVIEMSLDGRMLSMRDYNRIMQSAGMNGDKPSGPQSDADIDDIRRLAGL